MYRGVVFSLFMLISGFLCAQESINSKSLKRANELAQKFIITDGHVDLPYRLRVKNFRLEKEFLGIPYETNEGDFDYVRSKKGGLDAPFMSIYIPSKYQKEGGAKELADSLINMVEYIANKESKYFQLAHNPSDVVQAKKLGKIALPMGMENGAPIGEDISLIRYFKKRGISYVTLTHALDNDICDSSYDTTHTWKGLSPFGLKAIKEMEAAGIMIDVSHISDSSFYQVMRNATGPVIASHSSCRKFTPGFERNMSDDMISLMGKNKGVINVNFGSTFLDGNVVKYNDSIRNVLTSLIMDEGIDRNSIEGKAVIKDFEAKHPALFSDVFMVADHIDHIVQLAGIDCVGFGSDYDGVGDSLPTGLKDVADFPNLIAVLIDRGYNDTDIEKICGGNMLRVWQQVLDNAH